MSSYIETRRTHAGQAESTPETIGAADYYIHGSNGEAGGVQRATDESRQAVASTAAPSKEVLT
jgi:hypothetical protein